MLGDYRFFPYESYFSMDSNALTTLHFPHYTRSDNRNLKLGTFLKRELGFTSKRRSNGMVYLVKRRKKLECL